MNFTPHQYEWVDRAGDRIIIEDTSSVIGRPTLTAYETHIEHQRAAVYLPTEPDDVADFIAAVLDASKCVIEFSGTGQFGEDNQSWVARRVGD